MTDATGKTEPYKVFAPGRVLLVRYDWKPSDMKSGDTVTVVGNPDRKDPHFMYSEAHRVRGRQGLGAEQQIPD